MVRHMRSRLSPNSRSKTGSGVASGLLIPALAALLAAAVGILAAELKVLTPPRPPTVVQTIGGMLGSTRKPL